MPAIKHRIYDVLRRSVYLLRVDSGSCNGCEIEIFDTLTPYFDLERFGIKLVFSPRMADVLLVTGPVTRQFAQVLKNVYEAAPKPCVVVACGACACGGGIWYDTYATKGGVDKVIPVDTYIPGCPPRPQAILYGVLVALDVLDQKIRRMEVEADSEARRPPHLELRSLINNWETYRALKIELYRYLGYRIGSRVLRDLLEISAKCHSYEEFMDKAERYIQQKYDDARIISVLNPVFLKLKDILG